MAIGMVLMKCMFMMVLSVGFVKSDVDKDREECAKQLVGLATCLPYVGGTAKAPTPDCCTGLKQVLTTSKKCLCILIKDRNDPSLGLKINATLALGLPAICKTNSGISECPDELYCTCLQIHLMRKCLRILIRLLMVLLLLLHRRHPRKLQRVAAVMQEEQVHHGRITVE
ncbi:protein YLS3-like isoform X2 [Papaver somniferum]|uniref:protein YLS3-like isoform X2 n=1 Tax=Papaver somniferum TaxID=3469 RepID=UPI000E6F5AF4|nr:protein YLS3-like isoform X2 [Papaver somniferum]